MENHNNKKTDFFRIKNQKGFALILFLILLPLIMGSLIFLYIGTTQIEMKSVLNQSCRMELIGVQKKSSELIQSLMSLNRIIKLIKSIETISLATQIVLLPIPVISQFVKSITNLTKSASETIIQIQKVILRSLLTNQSLGSYKAKMAVQGLLQNYKFKTLKLLRFTDHVLSSHFSRVLSVEPDAPNRKLSTYRLKKNFEIHQKLSVQWGYRLLISPELKRWTNWSQFFYGSCSSTLHKENPWTPTLVADKFS